MVHCASLPSAASELDAKRFRTEADGEQAMAALAKGWAANAGARRLPM